MSSQAFLQLPIIYTFPRGASAGGILICPYYNGAYKLVREGDDTLSPGILHYGIKGKYSYRLAQVLKHVPWANIMRTHAAAQRTILAAAGRWRHMQVLESERIIFIDIH